jgi:hypothetical protein
MNQSRSSEQRSQECKHNSDGPDIAIFYMHDSASGSVCLPRGRPENSRYSPGSYSDMKDVSVYIQTWGMSTRIFGCGICGGTNPGAEASAFMFRYIKERRSGAIALPHGEGRLGPLT